MPEHDGRTGSRLALAAESLLLVAVWLWLVRPLFAVAPIFGHSTLLELERLGALSEEVAAGNLFPRWLAALHGGYGSPLLVFYAPLPYRIASLFLAFGASLQATLAWTYVVLLALAAAGCFAAARELGGRHAGLAATTLLPVAPYFLVDLYVRQGLGEMAGFAALPWALWALLRMLREATAARCAALAAAVGLVAVSHNLTFLIGVPALLLAAAGAGRGAARSRAVASVVAGIALAAPFWLPAALEMKHVKAREALTLGPYAYDRHFLSWSELLPGGSGWSFSFAGLGDRPVRTGELLLLGVAAGLALCFVERDPLRRRWHLTTLAGLLASVVMTTASSAVLWRSVSLLAYVQFPWRFLLLATVVTLPMLGALLARGRALVRLAVVAAIVVSTPLANPALTAPRHLLLDRTGGRAGLTPVAADELAALLSRPQMETPEAIHRPAELRRRFASGTSAFDEYLPRTVHVEPRPNEAAVVLAATPGVMVRDGRQRGARVEAELEVASAGAVAIRQFAFPGWRVSVDGHERTATAHPASGEILVAVAPGERRLEATFGATWARTLGWVVAILAAGALALVVAREGRARARSGAEPWGVA